MEFSASPHTLALLDQSPSPVVSASAEGICFHATRKARRRFQAYPEPVSSRVKRAPTAADTDLQLNPLQTSMYRRLLYGVKEYSAQQLAGTPLRELERVTRDHQKASRALHRLKVDKVYRDYNKLMNAIWPHLQIGTKFSDYEVDLRDVLPTGSTLHKLGISTREAVACLLELRLLPQNFLTLHPADLALR